MCRHSHHTHVVLTVYIAFLRSVSIVGSDLKCIIQKMYIGIMGHFRCNSNDPLCKVIGTKVYS
jgi:hypothetical protein